MQKKSFSRLFAIRPVSDTQPSSGVREGCDTTAYGSSRGSPRAFFPHHAAAISAAITGADAHAFLTDAASRNLQDSLLGLPPQQRAHA